ncbi:sortase domain-bontaining protein [Patescibacteria group bacterium]
MKKDIIVSEETNLLRAAQGKKEQPLWKVLMKATFVFVGVSFIAFGAINGKALYQQISDAFQISDTNADLLTDQDGDGLPDWWEKLYGFDPAEAGEEDEDPDEEKLVNFKEFTFTTDPLNPDTDDDGFDDFMEIEQFFDPTRAGGAFLDFDRDGLPDWWEQKFGFNNQRDSSEDDPDTDRLTNADEYFYGTDPRNPDTDGDGFTDGDEIETNYNPLGEGRLDTDQDGLTDLEEKNHNTDPRDPDTDGDGLSDGDEVKVYFSDPLRRDTDRDGYEDGEEVEAGFDPTKRGARLNSADTDDDGLSYDDEIGIGTDPNKRDSDGDGLNDGREVLLGKDPTNGDSNARPSATMIIDKIGQSPPIVWVTEDNEAGYQKGLEGGVIHLPGTVPPGQNGSSYITGHSSDYAWKPGNYKQVFGRLVEMDIGDEIFIELKYSSGKTAVQRWALTKKDVVAPDDQILFKKENKPVITVATCWPINTSWNRLYGKYDLQEVTYK